MRLEEALVGRWSGFVFINRDQNAAPLETYLGHVARDFPEGHFGDRRLTVIVRKRVKANWKVRMDAFAEVFHIIGLHPQVLAIAGDTGTQYDVWPDDPYVSRWLGPTGESSDEYPHMLSEQEKLDLVMRASGSDVSRVIPDGAKLRTVLAADSRDYMSDHDGCDYADLSVTEVNDGIQYTLFPNMMLFRQLNQPWASRFLPLLDDPNEHLFEMFIIGQKGGESEEEIDVKTFDLGPGQSF